MNFLSRRSTILLRIPKPSCWQRSVTSYGTAPKGSRSDGIIPRTERPSRSSRWSQSIPLSRSKSALASQYDNVMPEHECEEGEDELGRDDFDNDYFVTIEDNGTAISITNECINIEDNIFEDNSTAATKNNSWKFSSALLWVNDPQYIHVSSGQRVRTLGQFSRHLTIVSARLLCLDANGDEDTRMSSEIDSTLQSLHAVPPRGSLHPRGGIYCNHRDGHYTSKSRNLLQLQWNDGNESIFDLRWLMDHAHNNRLGRPKDPDDRELYRYNGHIALESRDGSPEKQMTTTTRVNKDIAIGGTDNPNAASIAKFDYREILCNEDALFEGMQEIFEHGAILVQNAPREMEGSDEMPSLLDYIVGDLGRRFSGGSLSHGSLYGDIFHVRSKANAENIAYTNVALPPHQDLVYYESKPFLQLLHCATNAAEENAIVGGESTLIDAMAAAEELRRISPELFDVLCRTEATFVKERHDSDMVSPRSHIVVDPAYGQVVEVNWSPPFEGPLQMHPRIAVEDYVRAYQAMECMFDDGLISDSRDGHNSTFLPEHLESVLRNYSREYTKEYTLQQGEVLVFNNQRMLHGRRSFRSFGNTERHLIGCYTDATETLSRYRQLLRDRKGKSGGGYGKRNPGSGCRWM